MTWYRQRYGLAAGSGRSFFAPPVSSHGFLFPLANGRIITDLS
jgi:hypothetical protein